MDRNVTREGPAPGLSHRAGAQVGRRLALPSMGLLSPPLRLLVACCWVFAAAASVVLLIPGAVPGTFLPAALLWAIVVGAAACAAASAAAACVQAASSDGPRAAVIARAVAVWGAGLVPVLALFAARAGWTAMAAGVAHIATGAGLAMALRAGTRPRVPAAAVAALAAGPWLVALLQGYRSPLAQASLWAPLSLLGVIALSFGAFLAVARVAEARHARARRWLPVDAGIAVVLVVLAVKAVVVALRLTWARGLFGEVDRGLWTLRSLPSWPHAVLVAVLVLVLVARTQRDPLRPAGQRFVTYVLVAAAASAGLAALVDLLLGLVVAAVTGDFGALELTFQRSHWLALAAAAGLSALLVGRRHAGSAGRTMAAVAVVYLLPPVAAIAVFEEDESLDLPAVWASAVQVDIALTAAVAVALAVGAVTRRAWIDNALAVRLLVIPTLAIHAGVALPDVVSAPLARPLVVLGALAVLVIAPAGVDRSRVPSGVLAGSALQLVLLVTYLLAANQGFADTSTPALLGVLWLAVPVGTILCCRLATGPPGLVSEVEQLPVRRRRGRGWRRPRRRRRS